MHIANQIPSLRLDISSEERKGEWFRLFPFLNLLYVAYILRLVVF